MAGKPRSDWTVGPRVAASSQYGEWVIANRKHLRGVMAMFHFRKQLAHEKDCAVCQEGIRIAQEAIGTVA